ncbi:MAG: c-type cytochrome [Acidobacteriaceae bacterium]|nr:c-type cytochrome [Acidobacteriaceae bacterium]
MRYKLVSLLALACVCPAQNPFAQDAQSAEKGRVVFRIYCAPCHGIQAKGGRGPDLTRGVFSSGETDDDLYKTIRKGVPGTEMPDFSEINEDVTWHLVSYIRSTAVRRAPEVSGNAHKGEELFWSKAGCGGCHRVGRRGGTLGPDLSRAGRQRSHEYLRESIVKPDAEITGGYERIEVVTQDGKHIVGVNRGYDNFSARLIDMSGKFHSFDRSEVKSITREYRSVMPDYSKQFSDAQIDDLLAYLLTLKGSEANQ